jgi:hypothetical protein
MERNTTAFMLHEHLKSSLNYVKMEEMLVEMTDSNQKMYYLW